MNRIGIMGGTFNPIHIGHLLLAEWVLDALQLKEIWFIPTGNPYKKRASELVSGDERYHMTTLAIQNNSHFKCLDMEIRREGYTYSYETLELLKEKYPENDYFFITGADCLFSIDSWKYPERIFQCCTLVAAVRDQVSIKEMEKQKLRLEQKFSLDCQKIVLFPFIQLPVSSTEIRQRISKGQSVKYLIPENVLSYIKEKGFYSEVSFEKTAESNEKSTGCQAV